jgi:predicted SnoaL-like aldol condensation-catalyzing enzyme
MNSVCKSWLVAGVLALGCAMQAHSQCANSQIEHNKDLIRKLASVDESTPEGMQVVEQLLAEDYVQHNAKILDYQGREGYARAVQRLVKLHKNPNYPMPVLLVADCTHVAAMLKEVRPDPEHPGKTYESFWFDIWRVQNGKLAEHWDPSLKGMDYHFDEVIRALSSAEIEPTGPGFGKAPPSSP